MKKTLMTILVSGLMLASCSKQEVSDNPLLQKWDTPFETAPFEKIKVEHYLPAFEAAIAEHNKEIQAIIDNAEAPNFGTFRNLSIVRAMELLTGCDVSFSNIPELMGAYGAALYAIPNS